MPIPVIVADDSTLSRKVLMRALPTQWSVDITQASNGREALTALREGKGHVIFLDLTMPEMDGFEVLQAMQNEQIECLAFVISADIQPKSKERVRALGGLDFLAKPVDDTAVENLLHKYGLYEPQE